MYEYPHLDTADLGLLFYPCIETGTHSLTTTNVVEKETHVKQRVYEKL